MSRDLADDSVVVNGTRKLMDRAKPLVGIVLVTGSLLGGTGITAGKMMERMRNLEGANEQMRDEIKGLESRISEAQAYASSAHKNCGVLEAKLIVAGIIK